MNPDETNPTTNTGATGGSNAGSVVPPALDFTSSETTSLSMADSLASAADNLTSAGMAAKEPDTGSIEMDQIGASDPSAQMERPDEPLVPAAPVPGSIGSVTSGPAVTAHDDTNVVPAAGAKPFGAPVAGTVATGATAGTSTFGTSNTAGFGASTTSSFGATSGTGFGATAGATSTGFGGTTASAGTSTPMSGATAGAGVSGNSAPSASAANEPYNPFAAKMGVASTNSSAQTSSMNVPTGSQPMTEKFSAKLPKVSTAKKPSMLTVILGILAVVSLVMAIVFAVLWQQAEANKEVVYEPTTPSEGIPNQTVAMITCTKNLGTDEAEVLAGLADHNLTATANFSNDQLGSVTMLNRYTFVDAAAAEATREHFDGTILWYGSIAEDAGVTSNPSTMDITETTVALSLSATAGQLMGEYAGLFGLTADADGKVGTSFEGIQANYKANGFACVED